ncbi:MAG: hypothetical protein NXI03_09640 [Alphaproteobacteria bacterium]|uniref:hypothetical protein n=1 Tax=Maricaulis alexandrii TaxID=2570354 RepID=UPI00110955C5|nr:hypothetical protein [Maricaulis alexandrii]MCR9267820.1 hypothetical protein [Alphaproteobacteria bacterium]
MFDFSKSELKAWTPAIPAGEYEFVSSRLELGELAVKLVRRHEKPGEDFACELTSKPVWHCIVNDEEYQDQLVAHGPGDMFEVANSPVIAGFLTHEFLYREQGVKARHWVIMTMQECVHIVAEDEPEFRTIYGEAA